MFKSTMKKPGKPIQFFFEGRTFTAMNGDSVAAALLRVGQTRFRHATNDDVRGPYCMMGVCFECLVEIDGRPNQQACQTMLHSGMRIRRQQAPNPDKNTKEQAGG